jgi:4-aminobutyrate aminotransferase/(S)-3-amino-2-methylpropionate transaminase
VPDLVTTAKSVGGGMPISAVTGRAEIMDAVHAGGLGGTYGGNPVAAAASLAVLDKIEREDLLTRSRGIGTTIMGRFQDFADRYDLVGDVRGRGAMCAIELVADRASKEPLGPDVVNAIARGCLERGVLVLTAGTYGNVIRLLPPITIDESLLADGLDVLDAAIGAATA